MSEKPRKTAKVIRYKCYAPESIMDIGWFDIPAEHQKIIKEQGGELGCGGIGEVGSDCIWCHYNEPHGYNAPNENAKEEEVE